MGKDYERLRDLLALVQQCYCARVRRLIGIIRSLRQQLRQAKADALEWYNRCQELQVKDQYHREKQAGNGHCRHCGGHNP